MSMVSAILLTVHLLRIYSIRCRIKTENERFGERSFFLSQNSVYGHKLVLLCSCCAFK